MLKAGRTYQLTVGRITEHGLYLHDEERHEVLLPNRYTSLGDREGDVKEVFVYHDSEDRLVATTERPHVQVGEAAFLQVVDRTPHGAFLDWGLHGKDLFLPNRNQQGPSRVRKSNRATSAERKSFPSTPPRIPALHSRARATSTSGVRTTRASSAPARLTRTRSMRRPSSWSSKRKSQKFPRKR